MPHVHMDSAVSQQQHSSHPSSSLFLAPDKLFWYFSSLPDVSIVTAEVLCCFLACSIQVRNVFACGDTYGSVSYVTPTTFKAPPEIVSDKFFDLSFEDMAALRRRLRFASSDMAFDFQRQILRFWPELLLLRNENLCLHFCNCPNKVLSEAATKQQRFRFIHRIAKGTAGLFSCSAWARANRIDRGCLTAQHAS